MIRILAIFQGIQEAIDSDTFIIEIGCSLFTNSIFGIYEDRQEIFWLGIINGVIKFCPESPKEQFKTILVPQPWYIISSIFQDKDNFLWFCGIGNRIWKFNKINETFKIFSLSGPDKNLWIQSIYQDKKGMMWFSSNNGLYKYNADLDTFYHYYYYFYSFIICNSDI